MHIRWLANLLRPRLQDWARGREPDFEVVQGPNRDVYLRRWHVLKPRWWRPGCYLHQMLRDDDDWLHDHPYASVSLVLADGLEERYLTYPSVTQEYLKRMEITSMGVSDGGLTRVPRAGDVIYRSSKLVHQLKVRAGTEPWTLFFTGRRLPKEWGFWCPKGWRHFRDYTHISDGKSGVGRGCGEE